MNKHVDVFGYYKDGIINMGKAVFFTVDEEWNLEMITLTEFGDDFIDFLYDESIYELNVSFFDISNGEGFKGRVTSKFNEKLPLLKGIGGLEDCNNYF